VAESEQPSLFLGPEPDAPRIAFLSGEQPVAVAGASEQGRVPVRVDGPLRTRGYVELEALRMRVQRRGRVRGAPVYLAPNDLVQVLGPSAEPRRVLVRSWPQLLGAKLAPFEGSYPLEGLASARAPLGSEGAPPGARYEIPSGRELQLHEQPNGPRVATLPAQGEPFVVDVLNQQQDWFAVRAGEGPYLIGWAQLGDAKAVAAAAPNDGARRELGSEPVSGALPARIVAEPGELKRVPVGTKIMFAEKVIGVFKAPGWARVLRVYDAGFADVFAAVDDRVTVRGLVAMSALQDLERPAAAPSDAAP
jgi:hypothetical protein